MALPASIDDRFRIELEFSSQQRALLTELVNSGLYGASVCAVVQSLFDCALRETAPARIAQAKPHYVGPR